MSIVFGFHTFCDLISGPILALSNRSLNTYYINHGVSTSVDTKDYEPNAFMV